MHDDEHVLRGVLELLGRDAARAQHTPHEPDVALVHLVERWCHHHVRHRCRDRRHVMRVSAGDPAHSSRNQCQPTSIVRLPWRANEGVLYTAAPLSTRNCVRSSTSSASAAMTAVTWRASVSATPLPPPTALHRAVPAWS